MKIVGITGGIGSGKTTVCKVFESLCIPVYYADSAAKSLYTRDLTLKSQMIDSFGEAIFTQNGLDKEKLASIVFNDSEKLETLNGLVHPAVKRDFESWLDEHQTSPYVIKEAAILIESGSYRDCNAIILVQANEEERIRRVCERDKVDRSLVLERIKNQMSEAEKANHADFFINNDPESKLIPQVLEIHSSILNS